jgi:hypothetical protein
VILHNSNPGSVILISWNIFVVFVESSFNFGEVTIFCLYYGGQEFYVLKGSMRVFLLLTVLRRRREKYRSIVSLSTM